jgi:hypothetical protein
MIALPARLHRLAQGDAPEADRAWLRIVADRMATGSSWPAAAAAADRAERDDAIRELRHQHYRNLRPRPAAEAIATDLRRYECSAWRHDRRQAECPHPPGSHRAALWLVLAAGTGTIEYRQVFEIIVSVVQPDPLSTAQNIEDHAIVEMETT